jgi:hypothetical protein
METEVSEISINGTAYVPKSEVREKDYDGEIKIVILQRGWIMIGKWERIGNDCKLHSASIIRRWGTTEGLGELAKKGKLAETILDKCHGVVEFDYLTVVASISVKEGVWQKSL